MSSLERAEEFRRKAEECEAQARRLAHTSLAADYLKLARQWRELADQAERFGLS
jgi:hypothetical protein